ncbi:MAG: DNA recombination protein RmuC [Methylotenera sp.]|nr:DNA recombination protein RmuC [Oligoflexia bacterium]
MHSDVSAFLIEIILFGLGLALVALVFLFIWLKGRFNGLSEASLAQMIESMGQTFQSQMGHTLQGPILDLTERMTRMVGESRESTTERLNKHFLEAQERIDRTLAQGRSELQTGLLKTTEALQGRFQSLELQVGTRLENIGKSVETKLNENLKEGFKHFEKVQEHLQAAELKLQSLNVVGQSISDLNSLLKLPHLRGGFGEATLERLLADFLPPGGYELQYAVVPNSPERVDAVVKMARQVLPIDSKFPREQVLPLFESQDPAMLEVARKALETFIRTQSKSIADKYIRPDHGTTDMAMLFLPSEILYFEVIRNGRLFEDITKLKVYPVSPNTLAMGLRSVTMAQEYYDMSRGVEKTIGDIKKARRHFEHFERKFEDIGKGLKKAQEAFETANTHLGRYESSVYRLVGEAGEPPELGGADGTAELPPPRAKGEDTIEPSAQSGQEKFPL